MIYLNADFRKVWASTDPFDAAESIEGQIFRQVKSRRTLRFEIDGKGYFIKIQRGIGWAEILKNLLMFKLPVLSVRTEYESICKLESLGIPTLKVAALGEQGRNPAKQKSFLVTEELTNTESLETVCKHWTRTPPPFSLKKGILEKVAKISRQMHTNGFNHRDFYLCHFLLDISSVHDDSNSSDPKIFVIDLHRAQIRKKTPSRWIIKDVAGLWFSAMEVGLTRLDILRFMKIYSNRTLRDILRLDASFWKAVHKKACRLYKKETGKTYAR